MSDDILLDEFIKNIKSGVIANQSKEITNGDLKYIDDSTKKLIELRILELEASISSTKTAEQWMKKREIRAAQIDRLNQARMNLQVLMILHEKGLKDIDSEIDSTLNILKEIVDIAPEECISKSYIPDTNAILDSFHVTERDIKMALKNSNIYEIIRNAKKNGWTLKISDTEIELFDKNGKRVELKDDSEIYPLLMKPDKNLRKSKTVKRK